MSQATVRILEGEPGIQSPDTTCRIDDEQQLLNMTQKGRIDFLIQALRDGIKAPSPSGASVIIGKYSLYHFIHRKHQRISLTLSESLTANIQALSHKSDAL